jgi:hypothetical protein
MRKVLGQLVTADGTLGKLDEDYIEALLEKGGYETLDEEMGNPAGVVSASLVQAGAQVLSGLEEELVFISDRVWQFVSYQRWRRLYQDAAAAGEALLVGVC